MRLDMTKNDVDFGPSVFVNTFSTVVVFNGFFLNVPLFIWAFARYPVYRMICVVPTHCLLWLLASRHVMSLC